MSSQNNFSSPELPVVLFISHDSRQCGVYQFGYEIGRALATSRRYRFEYVECGSAEQLLKAVELEHPAVLIFNHHPSTLPWLDRRVLRKTKRPCVGIVHEVTQELADGLDQSLFHYHIAADPSLLLRNPVVFKTGRLVPNYENRFESPAEVTIGSFGFATQGKGFQSLVRRAVSEFQSATINLHIPFAAFGDEKGHAALQVADDCRRLVQGSGIELNVTHDFKSKPELLDFLASNSLNAFFYDDAEGRGISSVIDYALAVDRPVAVTASRMFRHLLYEEPMTCIENSSFREILERGVAGLKRLRTEWSAENLVWDYERIVACVLDQYVEPRHSFLTNVGRFVQKKIRREKRCEAPLDWTPVNPVSLSTGTKWERGISDKLAEVSPGPLNRLLDDKAREHFAPVVQDLFRLVPDVMSRKIERANVQQAFVFDTVRRLKRDRPSATILSVGSFEDTATLGLKRVGYDIHEIDPLLNYDLSTFLRRPSTCPGSFDIIMSTSVIEHVVDDEAFLEEIALLLAPGGVAVLTCDFNDKYQAGDPLPAEDKRFYTQVDFLDRLMPKLADCALLETPVWEAGELDFEYGGCRYAFATFVFAKGPGIGAEQLPREGT